MKHIEWVMCYIREQHSPGLSILYSVISPQPIRTVNKNRCRIKATVYGIKPIALLNQLFSLKTLTQTGYQKTFERFS